VVRRLVGRWALRDAEAEPYRGPDFYGREHAHLFFGRGRECVAVTSMVIGNRVSLLHATSGAGKTSLLNAAVIPALEERGWLAVRSLPQNQPQQALKQATLDSVLPDLDLELHALDRTIETIGCSADTTLRDVKARALSLSRGSPEYVTLMSPYQPASADRALCTPFVVRFLSLDGGHVILARYLLALDLLSPARHWPLNRADDLAEALADTPVSRLRTFFDLDDTREVHTEVRRYLEHDDVPLDEFYRRLQVLWGSKYDECRLVLMLDQFEELFTRFVDKGAAGAAVNPALNDYRIRRDYFAQLARLFDVCADDTSAAGDIRPAVHILVSMRDEHIARLDELERSVTRRSALPRHHLGPLSTSDAADVIRRPARYFGYDYEDALFVDIRNAISSEGGIEPGHVQIVCTRLWQEVGQAILAAHEEAGTRPTAGVQAPVFITADRLAGMFRSASPVLGIFRDHFQLVLQDTGGDLDHYDVLDLLGPLIVAGGRRNIVPIELLTRQSLCREDIRKDLLERLRSKRIVRIEWRLGGAYAELTHEFLIGPINEARVELSRRHAWWGPLESGLHRLQTLQREGVREITDSLLEAPEVDALIAYSSRLDLAAHRWILEVLFRSAVVSGRPALIGTCRDLLNDVPVLSKAELLCRLGGRIPTSHWLDSDELAVLCHGDGAQFDEDVMAFVLVSALRLSTPDRGIAIEHWFRRAQHEGVEHRSGI
jgi:hypothetical protein